MLGKLYKLLQLERQKSKKQKKKKQGLKSGMFLENQSVRINKSKIKWISLMTIKIRSQASVELATFDLSWTYCKEKLKPWICNCAHLRFMKTKLIRLQQSSVFLIEVVNIVRRKKRESYQHRKMSDNRPRSQWERKFSTDLFERKLQQISPKFQVVHCW